MFLNKKKAIICLTLALMLGFFGFTMSDKAEGAFGLDLKVRQVKTADSPVVYYLDHARGKKKAYVNEQSYLTYGNKWSDVKILAQAEIDKWPDLRLVKVDNNPNIYYIKNGKKTRIVSLEDFNAFGFKWDEITPLSPVDLAQYKEADYVEAGLAGTTDFVEGNALSVSLDASSPKGEFLPTNTIDNLVAVLNLQATKERAVVSDLTFDIKGVFDASAIDKIYITDDSGHVFGRPNILNSNKRVELHFNTDPIVVYPNFNKKIYVYVNFKDVKVGANSTFYVSLENKEAVIANTAVIGGFPIKSETFKLVYLSNQFGVVKAEELPLNLSETSIGASAEELMAFKLSEISGKESVAVTEITIKNEGSARVNEITDLELRDSSNRVLARVSSLNSGKQAIFKLNNYEIKSRSYKNFKVIADIKDGEGMNINFNLVSVKATGETYGFNTQSHIYTLKEEIKITREGLQVFKEDLKEVKRGDYEGVVLAAFEIKSPAQAVTLENIELFLEKNSNAPMLDNTIYVINGVTSEQYDYFDGENFYREAVYADLNNIRIEKGKSLIVAFMTEIPDSVEHGDYYQAILKSINYRGENNESYSTNSNFLGERLSVSVSNIFVYPNNEEGETGYTKGETNVKLASFILETSSEDDVYLNSLTIKRTAASDRVIYDNGFSNLEFKSGYRRLGEVAMPRSDSYTFDNLNYKLTAGRRVELRLEADTDSDLNADMVEFMVSEIEATPVDSQITTKIINVNVNSHKVYFAGLEANLDALSGGSVKLGEDNNLIGSFSVKNNGAENLELKDILINTDDDGFSSSLGFSNLKITAKATGKRLGTVSSPVAGSNKVSLYSYKVLPGETAEFNVYVDADADADNTDIRLYFSDLFAEGESSEIRAEVDGEPTDSVGVNVY